MTEPIKQPKKYLLPCHDCRKMDYCRKCPTLAKHVLTGKLTDPDCEDYRPDEEIIYANGEHRRKQQCEE